MKGKPSLRNYRGLEVERVGVGILQYLFLHFRQKNVAPIPCGRHLAGDKPPALHIPIYSG